MSNNKMPVIVVEVNDTIHGQETTATVVIGKMRYAGVGKDSESAHALLKSLLNKTMNKLSQTINHLFPAESDLPMPTITYDDDMKQKYQSVTATVNLNLNDLYLTEVVEYGEDVKEAYANLISYLNKLSTNLNLQVVRLTNIVDQPLQIFQVTRNDTHMSTDVNDSYVIVAVSAEDAITMAASNARDEGMGIWIETARVTYLGDYTGPLDYSHVISTESRNG